MHYKNGRQAKIGDIVYGSVQNQPSKAYLVTQGWPGATSCNIGVSDDISFLSASGLSLFAPKLYYMVTSSDFLHIEDYLATLIPRVVEGEAIPSI